MIYDENLLGAFPGLKPKSQLLFEVSWTEVSWLEWS
jgi:hypothetical protein